MESQRFDEIAKALAAGASRRTVVRRLFAGIAGVGLTTATGTATGAAPSDCNVFCADQPGARGAQCRQTCKKCTDGPASLCFDSSTNSFSCKDMQADPLNCGGCDNICEAPFSACANGSCVCPAGTVLCGGDCIGTCGFGEVFIEALCECRDCSLLGGRCSDETTCPVGGAVDTCQNGCCCVSAGSLSLGCTPNTPQPLCCSGRCNDAGRCA